MLARAVGAEAGKWVRQWRKKGDGPIIINVFEMCYKVHFCPKVQAANNLYQAGKNKSQLVMADEGFKTGLFSISHN